MPICFLETSYAEKHLRSPDPKTFPDGRRKGRCNDRPVPVRVSSDTNPAISNDSKQEFLTSLTFNPDPLPVPRVGVLNFFRGQSKLLRVGNERADVILRHVDEVS